MPGILTRTSRLAPALMIAAFAGVPLAIAPHLLIEYEVTPKVVILLIVTSVLLLCRTAWMEGLAALLSNRAGRVLLGITTLQSISLLISTMLSSQPALSLAGTSWRRYGLVTEIAIAAFGVLCAACVATRRDLLRAVLIAISATGSAIALYAIAQYAGFDPFLERSAYTIQYFGPLVRVPGTLGHAVYLASFLAATLPIAVGLALESHGNRRLLFGACAALSLVAILLSGSRSGLVAVLCAGAVVLASQRRLGARRILPVALAGIVLIGAGLLVLNLAAGDSFRLRLAQWKQDFYGGPRLLVWKETAAMTALHPLAGFGPDTFVNEFRRRQSAAISRAYPDFTQESPHNLLLDIAFGQGLPGLLVVGGLVYLIFLPPTGNSAGPGWIWLRASAVATLASLAFLTTTVCGGLVLYGIIGLLVGTGVPDRTPSTNVSGARETLPPFAGTAAGYLALAFFLAAGAYLIQDLSQQAVADGLLARDPDAMERSYRASNLWFPQPADDLWSSRQFAALARASAGNAVPRAWAIAAEASKRAEHTSDNLADAAYQSAVLAFSANQAAEGEQKLRVAMRAAPTWYKPHLLMAQYLQAVGRAPEAEPEIASALDLCGGLRVQVEKILRPASVP
ncbi:MAG: O-antigen polymerase [Candidatus Solibacter sp.]|jgi:O-antigen ligase|nr:O-antigen polymerase [Candidatus Solibacter sp.]